MIFRASKGFNPLCTSSLKLADNVPQSYKDSNPPVFQGIQNDYKACYVCLVPKDSYGTGTGTDPSPTPWSPTRVLYSANVGYNPFCESQFSAVNSHRFPGAAKQLQGPLAIPSCQMCVKGFGEWDQCDQFPGLRPKVTDVLKLSTNFFQDSHWCEGSTFELLPDPSNPAPLYNNNWGIDVPITKHLVGTGSGTGGFFPGQIRLSFSSLFDDLCCTLSLTDGSGGVYLDGGLGFVSHYFIQKAPTNAYYTGPAYTGDLEGKLAAQFCAGLDPYPGGFPISSTRNIISSSPFSTGYVVPDLIADRQLIWLSGKRITGYFTAYLDGFDPSPINGSPCPYDQDVYINVTW